MIKIIVKQCFDLMSHFLDYEYKYNPQKMYYH
jgi:hypothetical protein